MINRILTGITVSLVCMTTAFAQGKEELMKLATDAEKHAAETAKDKVTAEIVMKKVDQAVKLLEKDGNAAFPKFRGGKSEFVFNGTYIWIHDLKGTMLVHPIKPGMEGNPMLDLKDSNGKQIFVEMNKLVKENTKTHDGWLEYVWPKPGEKATSIKTSYVKLAKNPKGGTDYVVGCGVYDVPKAEIEAAVKKLGK